MQIRAEDEYQDSECLPNHSTQCARRVIIQLMKEPKLQPTFKIEADIEVPMQVTDRKAILNVPSGKLINADDGFTIGELVSPSGDWLEIQASGTMNLNIREAFKLEDGHSLLASITGRSVPNNNVSPKFEIGEIVNGDEMYFISSILMETNSKKYEWANDKVFIGQMQEFIMPTKVSGRVKWDVFMIS